HRIDVQLRAARYLDVEDGIAHAVRRTPVEPAFVAGRFDLDAQVIAAAVYGQAPGAFAERPGDADFGAIPAGDRHRALDVGDFDTRVGIDRASLVDRRVGGR